MNCPRCNTGLKVDEHKGIEVDQCPKGHGMWLDYPELDQLEDKAFDEDDRKGTLMYAIRDSDISCPKCAERMKTFNYRAYDLPIDVCEKEHGFWLDTGEEDRVLELMKQRIKDLNRASAAEVEWSGFLRKPKSRSFMDRLRGR